MFLSASPRVSLAGRSPSNLLGHGQPVSGWLWHRVAGTISGRSLEDALVGEVAVEVSPGKLFFHIAS